MKEWQFYVLMAQLSLFMSIMSGELVSEIGFMVLATGWLVVGVWKAR